MCNSGYKDPDDIPSPKELKKFFTDLRNQVSNLTDHMIDGDEDYDDIVKIWKNIRNFVEDHHIDVEMEEEPYHP